MSQTALAEFDELKAAITGLVAPTLAIQVTSFESSQAAIDAGKQVKDYLNRVEKKRKELTAPLRAQIDTINDYVKSIVAPLAESERHIKAQLTAFEVEQAERRKKELARLEAERRRKEEELRAQQEAEKAAAAKPVEDDWFGAGDDAEAAGKELATKHADQKFVLDDKLNEREWEIRNQGIKNTRKIWKCAAENMDLVPREFQIITLNEKAVLAAARAGTTKIPGVRIWQETSVALGARTRVPDSNLKGGAKGPGDDDPGDFGSFV